MKKLTAIALSASAFLTAVTPAWADPGSQFNLCPADSGGEKATNFNILCQLNPATALPDILTFALIIAVVIALFYLIWGGIKWITSGGDKGNVETARGHIIAAIIGLIVVFLAWFIINLIMGVFFGRGLEGGILSPRIQVTEPE